MSFDLHHHIQINAKPESIYQAITTATGIKQWWTTDVIMDEKVGGRAVFGFGDHSTFFEMAIERLDPYKTVHWACTGGNAEEWIGTSQIFEINQPDDAGMVDLRFSHTGWKSNKGYIYLCNTTWGYLMVNLKLCIEEGISQPYFT